MSITQWGIYSADSMINSLGKQIRERSLRRLQLDSFSECESTFLKATTCIYTPPTVFARSLVRAGKSPKGVSVGACADYRSELTVLRIAESI